MLSLSSSQLGNNGQQLDEKQTNHLPSISRQEVENYCNNHDNNNQATLQGSPAVFLAKVTVAQQQLNLTNHIDGQPTGTGDISDSRYTNLDSNGTNVINQDGQDCNNEMPLLYVEQNDVISIEQQPTSDDEWFLGKSDQQVGRIPRNSCLILDDQIPPALCRYLSDNQYFNLNVCFASFVAQDVGDLSITKGDIIVAIVPVNEHWMQGQVCFDSQANRWPKLTVGKQVGTFPLNHCWHLDTERVKTFCYKKIEREKKNRDAKSSSSSSALSQQVPGWSFNAHQQPPSNTVGDFKKPFLSIAHSSSLSSGSSSLYSTDFNQAHNRNDFKQLNQQPHYQKHQHQNDLNAFQNIDRVDSSQSVGTKPPPPRPAQLPQQMADRQKSSSARAVSKPSSILTSRQQDKIKGWLHTVKKKTARLSTRITASLGLISLTRDEEFERHYDSFKQLEKSIRVFIKNLTQFVEHFENFLVALQSTSDNLADFYRDKSYQREINEMRKKNKALNCEHFHAFKRTVDRQVIAVASQLLQKFGGPHQLVHKRSAKLLDYDTKTKELESCRDLDKKASLHEGYLIAKELYDRINGQLIEELPLFNQFALEIFRECVLVLLESRRNLMLAYTQQTANLLDTPLMASYTASDVASTILMSSELAPKLQPPLPPPPPPSTAINSKLQRSVSEQSRADAKSALNQVAQASGSSSSGIGPHDQFSRPHSAMSQFSSEFDQMAIAAREISSTPLSHHSENVNQGGEPPEGDHLNARYDEPDGQDLHENGTDGSSDNKHNENIESTIKATISANQKLCSTPAPRNSAPTDDDNKGARRRSKSKHPIYITSWPFVATGPNQLSIACNQPLKLIKGCDECGNADWSLVKDKRGHLGYVPTSYIKPKE